MAKPVLVFKLRIIPERHEMNSIKEKYSKDYYLIFLTCGQGEPESVKLLSKGRHTATLTKHLKKLTNGTTS